MKILIDGEEVKCLNDVKIIVDIDEDRKSEMHVTCTHEGIIQDLVEDGKVVAGSHIDWCNIIDGLRNGHEEDEGPAPDYFKSKNGSCSLTGEETIDGFGVCQVYQCTDQDAVFAFLEDVGGALHPLGGNRVVLHVSKEDIGVLDEHFKVKD